MKWLLRLSLYVLALTAIGVAGCTAEQEHLDEGRAQQIALQSSAVHQALSQPLVPRLFLPGQQVGALRSADAEVAIRLTGHQGPVRGVDFSPDGRWLVTVSDDNTARLWDVPAFPPAGLTDTNPSSTAFVLGGHGDWISAVAFSPDTLTGTGSRWLVTASWDGTARLWDLSASDPAGAPFVLRGHHGPLGAVAFSPDARWLATAGGDDTARLWDLTAPNPATGSLALRGHEGPVLDVAFSPDTQTGKGSHWLITTGQDSTARLWDISTLVPGQARTSSIGLTDSGLTVTPYVLGGHGFGINTAVFSPDGRWLATASWEGIVRLWDLSAPDPSAASLLLFGHQLWISAMVFSPDSHWLVTAGVDDTARLWDLRANDPSDTRFVLRDHQDWIIAAIFSPDNRLLVTASADSTARLWDLRASDPSLSSLVLCGHGDWINAVAFSPDGRRLVTGSRDGSARLWDVATLLYTGLTTPNPAAASRLLPGHRGSVLAAAFSPDIQKGTGIRWLATGSGDGSARLWPLGQAGLSDLAQGSAGREVARVESGQAPQEHDDGATCSDPSTVAGRSEEESEQ